MIPMPIQSPPQKNSRLGVAERPYESDSTPLYVTTPSTQTSLIHSEEDIFQGDEREDLEILRTYDDAEILNMERKLSQMKQNYEDKKKAAEKHRKLEKKRDKEKRKSVEK